MQCAVKNYDVKCIAFKRIGKDFAFKMPFVKLFFADWQKGPLHKFCKLKSFPDEGITDGKNHTYLEKISSGLTYLDRIPNRKFEGR